jgi:hypothetical protein
VTASEMAELAKYRASDLRDLCVRESSSLRERGEAKAALYASIDAMAARITDLERDAARYRWLRDKAILSGPATKGGDMVWCVIGQDCASCYPSESDELDAAIDAAMATSHPTSAEGA